MRYLIGLLITIAVIIFVIIRLLAGGDSTPVLHTPALASFANSDTLVRLTITNPVQANQTHNEVQITVGQDSTDFVLYRGYNKSIVRSKSYSMSEASYRTFLRALDLSGQYTKGNDDPELKDETGYCGLGSQYVYEIIGADGDSKQHYWSTDCGQKTFNGNAEAVKELFQRQVPDYFQLTKDVDFS